MPVSKEGGAAQRRVRVSRHDTMENEMPDAPRLRAYWSNAKEPLVGLMSRAAASNLLSLRDDETADIDLSITPLADLIKDSVVLRAVAYRSSAAAVRIAVFRDDPKDGPAEHVNQDQYDFWPEPEAHPNFSVMVAQASTCCNTNMKEFCAQWVPITKRQTGDGFAHHLSEVPTIHIVLRDHE